MPPGVPRGEQVELGVRESQVAPAQPGTQGDVGAQSSWRPQRLPLRCRAPPSVCAQETALGRGALPGRTGGSSPRAHGSPGGAVCVGWSAGSCSARRRLPGTGEGSHPAPQGGDASLVCQSSERDQKGSPGYRAKLQDIFRSVKIPAPPPNFNV